MWRAGGHKNITRTQIYLRVQEQKRRNYEDDIACEDETAARAQRVMYIYICIRIYRVHICIKEEEACVAHTGQAFCHHIYSKNPSISWKDYFSSGAKGTFGSNPSSLCRCCMDQNSN